MDKNLGWKIVLIVGLTIVALWTLYPPDKTLKPGIDLAGGTSLIYEIDTQGLREDEKKDLAEKMITILRRRIDPANIQNLVWRPQGNTRFEIQMPLTSEEARQKRQAYEDSLNQLLAENVNPAIVMQILKKSPEQRAQEFEKIAGGQPERLEILNNLAKTYDERKELREQNEKLLADLKTPENLINLAGLDLEKIRQNAVNWSKLDDQQVNEELKKFPGSEGNLDLLTRYVKMYRQWSEVADQLTDNESGKNIQFERAKRELNNLNISEDQINVTLEMDSAKASRKKSLEELKAAFPQRSAIIDKVVAAFDTYRPLRGGLDDPKDLQRMLKGAGILEFRILPTIGHPDVDSDTMAAYVETLKTKGPKYASDDKYKWCEVENPKEWGVPGSVIAEFGEKVYVLASNKPDESMLHKPGTKEWSLRNAQPQADQQGRRAIGFSLDDKGGRLFGNITGKNLERPLCILLDNVAISAPKINDRITNSGIITGSFTQTQVMDMVNKLNAGSLPARLIEQPISVRTIGPSIGADNRDKGIRSGMIGLAVVIACMAVYYLFAGAIADVALLLNLLFMLAIMALLNATFTLPGIAGAVLTIGMSVDANVLIFERIREEQAKGASLGMAIKNGYEKAFSAIFDSNLTTIISAMILYWVASEDIKGFAIVLMLGLGSSMFTALFVTHVIFNWLVAKKILKNRLLMLHLIRKPNINWMKYRPVFFTISAILTIGGIAIFFMRDEVKNSKYDIEFTGGTSVLINLKEGVNLSRQNVEDKIQKIGVDSGNSSLAAANVYSIGESERQYEITTRQTNKAISTVTFSNPQQTVESIKASILKTQENLGRELTNLDIAQDGKNPASFIITTSQLNTSFIKDVLAKSFPDAAVIEPVVDEVVNNAVLTAFGNDLEIKQNLQPEIISQEKITEKLVEEHPLLTDFIGGTVIKCRIKVPSTIEEINGRIDDLRFKPDTQDLEWYSYKVFSPDMTANSGQTLNEFAYVSANPEAAFRELSEDEQARFVENETTKVLAAAKLETSLPRVTQISPSVGAEAKTRALIAIILSLFALLVYIWVRFGNLRYGLGAVATLFHDTCLTVGAVVACTYIAGTAIGQALLIGDFKIDLAMIAAFLTLIGYSLNDSIVIYDRIRENKRKSIDMTPELINNSLNETLSRTLLTGITTFLVVLIMYIFGGRGLRGFNFAMTLGIIIGTYSSIAISAPILLMRHKLKKSK